MDNLLRKTLGIMVLSIVMLSACQPKTPTPTAYPAPGQTQASGSAYPGPSAGVTNYVLWADVENAITKGTIDQAYLDQTGHVTLILKDKSIMLALGPTPDAFTKLIEQCGTPCKDIKVNK